MVLELKNVIKIIIYKLVDLLTNPSKKITPKSLLLIRLDGIGDYVLFRNFIKVLRENEKYKYYSITLLGNASWKTLSKELDEKYIDNYLWVERYKFNNNLLYRYKKLQELVSSGYEIVLSPIYSREPFIADNIVKLINAKEKIGSVGNLSNIKKWQKDNNDKYYTKLINAKEELMFEFNRNKEFFQNLLNTKIDISKPTISLEDKKSKFMLPKKYATLFVGGSENLKKWNLKNFFKIGDYLNKEYNYDIVLCGSKEEINEANELVGQYDNKFLNLIGKTSLPELLRIIYNGDLILSNETSAPHFATALDVKNIFVLFSGKYYGWFCPYPKQINKNYYSINHPYINKNWYDKNKLSKSFSFLKNQDINELSIKKVKTEIDKILKNISK